MSTRRRSHVIFAVLFLAAFGLSALPAAPTPATPAPAADDPGFSGTWVIDVQKSRLDARFRIDEGTFVVEQKADQFRFSRTFITGGKPDSFSYELTIDGPEKTVEMPDRSITQRLGRDGAALVFTAKTVLKDGRTANDVVRYSLEDHGATFVAEESFRAPVLKYDNRWVAARKAGILKR